MHEEPKKESEPSGPNPSNLISLKKRKSSEDYWEGYKAGLTAALHGIQKSLDHFDDMLVSRMRENGKN
jgi:hypothetical protein